MRLELIGWNDVTVLHRIAKSMSSCVQIEKRARGEEAGVCGEKNLSMNVAVSPKMALPQALETCTSDVILS